VTAAVPRLAVDTGAAATRPARFGRALRLCFLAMVTLSVNQVLDIADTPLSDLLFILAAGVVGIDLLQGRSRRLAPADQRRTPPVVLVGVLLLLTSGVLSSLWSLNPALSMASLLRFLWTTMVWLWLMRSVCRTRIELLHLVRGFKITLLISCGAALAGQLGFIALAADNWERRQQGFYAHPNDLAGLFAVGLPFVLLSVPSQAGQRQNDWLRRLAFVGLIAFCITTTGSMTGIASMVLGAVVFGVFRASRFSRAGAWRHPLRTSVLAIVCAAGLVALAGSDLPALERLTRLMAGDSYVQGSVDARSDLNAYVIANFDDYLVIGTGPSVGEVSPDSDLGYAVSTTASGGVHNLYLKTLLEFGLLGLVGLLVILVTLARRCARLVRPPSHPDTQALAAACLGSLSAALAFGFFSPIAYQRYFWLPMGFIGVLWAIERHERRARVRAVGPVGNGNGRNGHGNGNGRRPGDPAPASPDPTGIAAPVPLPGR
jgi:O-antigen ligase